MSLVHNRRMSVTLLSLLVSLTAALSSVTAQNRPQPPEPAGVHDEWVGVYMSGAKIGFAHSTMSPAVYNGSPATKEVSHSEMKIQLLGQMLQENEDSVGFTDLKGQPLVQTMDVTSNGSKIHLVAHYDYTTRKILCTLGTGPGATNKAIDIPRNADLAGDSEFATSGRKLSVGLKYDVYTLDPATITLDKIHIEVTGLQEVVNEFGKKLPTFVTKVTMSVGETTEWLDKSGNSIKGEMSLGPVKLTMTAESRQHALNVHFISPAVDAATSPAYSPSADLAIATSVRPDRLIDDPRKLRRLQAQLQGIPDKRLLISDDRQKETPVPGGNDSPPYTVNVDLNAENIDAEHSALLPIQNAELSSYLAKAAYLDTDDPNLRKIALGIRGNEKNTLRIALAIRDWVHQNMTPDASIGVPRSATDLNGRRRGVCRDYATLYAALARIAGVPTRLCAGVVYADLNGTPAFFYHAWAESWVGKWVAVDPTLYDVSLGIDYVDATHIKFAQGDVTQMYDAVSVVGKLKISIQ